MPMAEPPPGMPVPDLDEKGRIKLPAFLLTAHKPD
jgi:hypothetical protein